MKERGRPTKHFFLPFFFFLFKVTAILGAEGRNQNYRTHLDFFFFGGGGILIFLNLELH